MQPPAVAAARTQAIAAIRNRQTRAEKKKKKKNKKKQRRARTNMGQLGHVARAAWIEKSQRHHRAEVSREERVGHSPIGRT